MACGIVKSVEESFIVVAGGLNDSNVVVDTVELLPLNDPREWKFGPPIPVSTFQSSVVQFDNTFMIAGGFNEYPRTSVLELGTDLQWSLKHSLNTARNAHVAFVIPDEWTNCF